MTERPSWGALAERALAGEAITPDEARAVLAAPDEELLPLVAAVGRVRRAHFGTAVKLNFLLNVKSGLCPEDCHYCSQSSLSTADIARYPLRPVGEVTAAAGRAVDLKAARFCMVASGRGPTDREVDQVCQAVAAVRAAHPRLEVCACLGLLKGDQAERLRAAGVFAYNHNLNTSERFYPEICATHTYRDRVETVERARAAGLSPCCGALFGMGEELEDVIALGYALRALRVDSIPVNFLIPIPGTPLAGRAPLGPRTALKILCLFRLLNPAAELRIAGGREVQLRWLQPLGLEVANSIFVGDYLTTTGQPPPADFAMIRDLGLSILGHEGAAPDEAPTAWGEIGDAGRLTRRPNA
ncbi:MAG: biotin synthase BioB [Candidatus Rokubacteria bacterium 13_1_40CM_69_27]|nr:MAG: biotin synthase BioB [Candidatus Rokubacteria bacterium 13_1_40CM_69_27]OLC30315.1 MAG: biotin synthase BioB [Candidatus Rokubacteria bacterium 13_1_40CM_4_69_5]